MTSVMTEVRFEEPKTQEYLDDLVNSIYKVIQDSEVGASDAAKKAAAAKDDNAAKKTTAPKKDYEQEDTEPTAFDQINGGIRQWLNRRACKAPKVKVNEIVQIQRQVNAIKKEQLNEKIDMGPKNAYAKMYEHQEKLKERAYRPQARMNFIPQSSDAFNGPYNGKHGTAGLPSNQPNRINAYRDYSLDTNRGRLLPGLTPEKPSIYVDFY